ncbi:nucleotide-diphospho-sugar transferase [Xylogone sp. PMI_703]|nr:nucleotide-diphospho-sugar transferase [Xylogone sp. PMI_703]
MVSQKQDVYATLLLNNAYLPGAMVLAHSLKDAGTTKKLAVLFTPDTVSEEAQAELRTIYNYLIPVERVSNSSPANLHLMGRGDLHSTFTKINLWKLGQFRKIVYMDADVLALRAPDELFDIPAPFSAAPDIGWPDIFNTGVMVLTPNMGDYYALDAMAKRGISFDGADQGLLNMHFKHSYNRLSFTYNVTPSAHYQYLPAYKHFQSGISATHFIGQDKPWTLGRETSQGPSAYDEMVGRWWAVYDKHYRSQGTENSIVGKYVKGEWAPGSEGTHRHEYHQEWNPSEAPPPTGSRPEASNFPGTHYNMSSDPTPFRGWYEESQRPAPIFPWEHNPSKPARIFPEDQIAQPEPEPEPQPQQEPEPVREPEPEPEPTPAPRREYSPPRTVEVEEDNRSATSPVDTTTAPTTPTDPWGGIGRANVWDEMPEIERYVDAFQRHRKGQVQVLQSRSGPGVPGTTSPPGTVMPGRKPSLKLTEFPSEVERPSLPVTPAPVRPEIPWPAEQVEEGELPVAVGVPAQEDWVGQHSHPHPHEPQIPSQPESEVAQGQAHATVVDCPNCGFKFRLIIAQNPTVQLDKLTREQTVILNTKMLGRGSPPLKEIPKRDVPFGSEGLVSPTYVQRGPRGSMDHGSTTGTVSTRWSRPSKGDEDRMFGSDAGSTAATTITSLRMEAPSYKGPGAAWEKDEGLLPPEDTTRFLPSEEEQDVLVS